MNRIFWPLLALGLVVALIVFSVKSRIAERDACEQRGGVLLRSAGWKYVCVDLKRIGP